MKALKRIFLLPLLALTVVSCTIDPPLHLRATAETEMVLVTDITTDLYWQADWATQWQFGWAASVLGPVGYTMPKYVRMHDYTLGENYEPIRHDFYNFNGTYGTTHLFLGVHNLLFHNLGSEVVLFRSETDLSDLHAYTRVISSGLKSSTPVMTAAQKAAAATRADDIQIEEPVALAPDDLFTVYDYHREITDNLDDYELIDGKYVLKIQGDLTPVTFIYLVQIKLLNNLGRVIGSAGGLALTGMADDVNLPQRMNSTSTVSVPTDLYINPADNPDLLGARVMTFGIPGCCPTDPASVAAAPSGKHYVVASISFATGKYKNISIDVTDQVRALPMGGVITLEVDVNDFPPEDIDPPISGGGGFDALVSGWGDITGGITIGN